MTKWPIIFGILLSCAHEELAGPSSGQHIYSMTDHSGVYSLVSENGYKKDRNEFVSKYQLFSETIEKKELERSITISTIGWLKDVKIFRPKISQFTTWFEGQKYFTEMKLDEKSKVLKVKLRSPESKWNRDFEVSFPQGTGLYCFFSQLIECVAVTGFIKKAIEKRVGQVNLHVIWDGYPYFQQQYVNLPEEIFSAASFSYDANIEKDEWRFSLDTCGQIISFIVDEKQSMKRKLWVTQGLSIIKEK